MPKFECVLFVGKEDERLIAWAGEIEARDLRQAEYIITKDHFSGNPQSEPVEVDITIVEGEKE